MIRIGKYNIADTTPSAEDELITEQIFPDTPIHKRIKTTLSRSDSVALFPELSYQEIANKIGEPLSNVKIKLLEQKTTSRNYSEKKIVHSLAFKISLTKNPHLSHFT
jgi:hypothetical protein